MFDDLYFIDLVSVGSVCISLGLFYCYSLLSWF